MDALPPEVDVEDGEVVPDVGVVAILRVPGNCTQVPRPPPPTYPLRQVHLPRVGEPAGGRRRGELVVAAGGQAPGQGVGIEA